MTGLSPSLNLNKEMDQIVTHKYKVDGISLNVAEIGKGESLVLIHGWSNNWLGWTLLAHQLAPYYHLYMVDLPGFGDSDRLEEYSLETVTAYVDSFIKRYVPKPKALIGASGGTFVVAELIRRSKLSTNLIFIGTVFKGKRSPKLANLYKSLLAFSADRTMTQKILGVIMKSRYSAYFMEKYIHAYEFDKKLVDTYQVPGRKKITGKSYVQLGLSYMEFYMDEFLEETRHRTLLLFGEGDKYVRPEDARALVAKIKNRHITLDFVQEAGHGPAYEQPQRAARAIRNFLERDLSIWGLIKRLFLK